MLAIRVFANNKPAEIAVNERPIKLTRLQWSSLNPPLILTSHYAGVQRTKEI